MIQKHRNKISVLSQSLIICLGFLFIFSQVNRNHSNMEPLISDLTNLNNNNYDSETLHNPKNSLIPDEPTFTYFQEYDSSLNDGINHVSSFSKIILRPF